MEVVQCVLQCHTQPRWLCLAEIWALAAWEGGGAVGACVLLSVVVGGWWKLMHGGNMHTVVKYSVAAPPSGQFESY